MNSNGRTNNLVQEHSFDHSICSKDNTFLAYELRKQYGNVKAVQDVSFRVKRQECFGLLGVNGAGKSTAFRMMTGGEIPDSGIMYLNDISFGKDQKQVSELGFIL